MCIILFVIVLGDRPFTPRGVPTDAARARLAVHSPGPAGASRPDDAGAMHRSRGPRLAGRQRSSSRQQPTC